MLDVFDAVLGTILVAYLLRLGYYIIVKRQRTDWHREGKRFKQELTRMRWIMKRLAKYYWRGWH